MYGSADGALYCNQSVIDSNPIQVLMLLQLQLIFHLIIYDLFLRSNSINAQITSKRGINN